MKGPWHDFVDQRLDQRRGRDLLRKLSSVEPISPVRVERDGKPLSLFSSNDYLGLSAHPRVKAAIAAAAERYGTGPRGSALVCGYTDFHLELEDELSALKGAERTLLTPTGYAANMGTIAALGGRDCEIFSDALNHASIIDGIALARRKGAALSVYRHGDVEHLASLMQASDAPRKLIVTDGLFSMDGDLAPLPQLVELRDVYDALLVVDEAHATLVFGGRGAGVAEHFGVSDRVDISIGTLSKAVAAQGGFVSGSAKLVELVLNESRSFVFSTAIPVPIVAGALAAIDVAADEGEHRERLFGHVRKLSGALQTELLSPIVPIVVGDADETMRASQALLDRGFHIPGIRPPTVPSGTSRLRIALSAAHGDDEVERLVDALRDLDLTATQ